MSDDPLMAVLGLYAGSKAAGVAIHETLRLELEPFDVKVITVVMGRVKTNIFREEDLRLPPSSMYASIEQEIGRNARGKNAGPESLTMDPQTFAGQLASDMLAGASGLVWRGPYSSLVRLIVAWAPKFLTVGVNLRRELGFLLRLLLTVILETHVSSRHRA